MSANSPTIEASAALAQLDLDALLGPFVIGTMLAMFLQGVTLHQSGVFWLGCRRMTEPVVYMVVVSVIQLLDLAHTVSCVNTIYKWTVRDYGNPATLAISPWSFMVEPVMAAVAATIVHLFYAHRILLISDGHGIGKVAAGFISVLTLVQLAFGSAVSSKIVTYDYQFERFIAWLWGACVWLGTLAATDLLICVTYTYYLNRVAKEMSGPFVHSTQMVLKVALVVLATNGCSALVAVIATVLFGSLSGTNWHAIPQLCLAKMLTLSLLVCLNARALLSDLIGATPSSFPSSLHHHHHHPSHLDLKRRPLGSVLPILLSSSSSTVGGGQPGGPSAATAAAKRGGPPPAAAASRPGTGKSTLVVASATDNDKNNASSGSFVSMSSSSAKMRGRGGGGGVFDVRITRDRAFHIDDGRRASSLFKDKEEEEDQSIFGDDERDDDDGGGIELAHVDGAAKPSGTIDFVRT